MPIQTILICALFLQKLMDFAFFRFFINQFEYLFLGSILWIFELKFLGMIYWTILISISLDGNILVVAYLIQPPQKFWNNSFEPTTPWRH